MEEIENEDLVKAVIALSDTDKELITMLINGFKQSEIGAEMGVSQQSVSKRIKKIQKVFRERL